MLYCYLLKPALVLKRRLNKLIVKVDEEDPG